MNGNQGQGRSRNQPGGDRRKPRTKARHRLRPEILALEDRRLLSTFTVTDPSDSLTDGLPTVGTLRWAVGQADGASTPSTIAFSLGSSPTTITLTNGQLELSNTVAPITIQGPGQSLLAVSGDGLSLVFAVDAEVTATLSGLTITGGSADSQGGGLDVAYDGSSDLVDCTISGNSADSRGGGIYNGGTIALTGCTVADNSAGDPGGGVYNNGTISMTGCTVSGNSAGTVGGGVYVNYGSATLTDCTISGNSDSRGAGLQVYYATVVVVNCTISGNSAVEYGGSGVQNYSGQVSLTNTIVAANPGGDIEGTVSGNNNLIGTGGSGGLVDGVDGNIVGVANPVLGPLGYYGGPTETIALEPGSPAIGAGVAVAGVTTDQRGFSLASPPDIGAFQAQAGPLVVNTTADGDTSRPGTLTLREAVNLADVLDDGATIEFDPTVFAGPSTITLTLGQLDLSNPTGPIKIEGPGSGLLGIDGDQLSRIFQIEQGVQASISGLTLENGSQSFGGAILNQRGDLTLTGCLLLNNTAPPIAYKYERGPGTGGAIDNQDGTLSLVGCTLTGNTANVGGAIADGTYSNHSSDITLTDCTFSDNVADQYETEQPAGGAIFDDTFQGLTTLTMVDCSLTGNAVVGGSNSQGGAIDTYNYEGGGATSDTTLSGCTIADNTSSGQAGGVNLGGNSTLTDCTITGNSGSSGAGIQVYGNSTLELVACTITGNASPGYNAGGLAVYTYYGYTPQVTLYDTIIAGNTGAGSADNIGGDDPGDVTGSFNLIGVGGSGALNPSDNLLNVANPGLTPLGYYGGPTETVALEPGSPAIGAGVAIAGVTTDQRGFPLASPPDIGAFQAQAGPLVVNTTADGNTSPPGTLTLREAVNLADVLEGGATIEFDPTVFANPTTITLTNGQLELSNPTGPITIDGPGAGLLAIDGDKSSGIFEVDAMVSASISGLTIQNSGDETYGGGVDNHGTLALDQDMFLADSATSGGGLANDGTVTIVGCTFEDNNAEYGGGVLNLGTATLEDCSFLDNSAYYDGGGMANYGNATLVGCSFNGNQSNTGGGFSGSYKVSDLIGCTFTANVASGIGGALYFGFLGNNGTTVGSQTATDCVFTDNQAADGGAICVQYSAATITGCVIVGNSSIYGHGGGVFLDPGDLTLIDTTITGNSAVVSSPYVPQSFGSGGGLCLDGNASLTDCTISGNSAEYDGGGVFSEYGQLSIANSSIQGNQALYGAGLFDDGNGSLTGCTISGNSAGTEGGGVFSEYGQLSIANSSIQGNQALYGAGLFDDGNGSLTGCTISGNSAGTEGGGVLAEYGQLSITDSTIQGNQALYGAGLFNFDDSVTLTGTTVSGNAAITSSASYSGQGGGLFIGFGGTLAATDSTIADNTAALEGGGIFNQGPANLSLVACTVSGNSAGTSGGGLYNYTYSDSNAYATLTDTIIADNTTPDGPSDIAGADADLVTGSFNLIGTGGSGGLSPSDNLLNVADPGLAPLGYYGGPTETMPLLPGSPAIDAGSNALDVDSNGNPLTTDQRGLPRIVNGTVDIGAFESSGFVITVLSGSESTLVGTAFPNPLSVEVSPVHAGDPVAGGIVTFSAPGSGPSATLSADSSTIDASGEASVTATANPQAGSYQVTVDSSGAKPAEIGLQNVFATVSNFQVAWGGDSASLVLQADGLRLLPSGRSIDIPWSGIRSFTLTFDYPITLNANEISVTGINVASYGPVTITGSGESYTITLAQPINAADRITLTINNPLLGSFTRELDVLPGDVNDDGVVNAQDLALERDAYVGQPVSYIPLIFEDILGDGSVDLADYNAVRAKSGTKLPPKG